MLSRLSESDLFDRNRAYYSEAGAEAWGSGKVPSYATSHAGMARAYAEVIRGFVLDLGEPITVLELGSGSGQFGFLLALELADHLADGRVTLLLTDQSSELMESISQHPAFERFPRGLRFLVVDAMSLPDEITGPLVVIANYLFDSLPQDAFFVRDGVVRDVLVENLGQPDARVAFADVTPYANALVQQVAETRLGQLSTADGYYLFPVRPLEVAISATRRRSDTLLLVTDKGWVDDAVLTRTMNLAEHDGAFSLSVDFLALAAWAHISGGWSCLPRLRPEPLACCAFAVSERSLPETRRRAHRAFADESPFDCIVSQGLGFQIPALSIAQALAVIRLAAWDPSAFQRVSHAFHSVSSVSPTLRAAIGEALEAMQARLYPLPGAEDQASALAEVWFRLGEAARADELLMFAASAYGPQPHISRARAACALQRGAHREAREHLEQARALDPFDPETTEALMRLDLSMRT